ncbi:MAG: insulinase family protein [Sphaerobacteraceae bacterium]|nr:MAG: insulinase family protein [Sphaerobacteraceae bacterium]
MDHVRSASLIITFSTGARHEPDEHAGVSHFLEHMVFKGTADRPDPITITREIEEVGGILNAGTSRENTNYWVKVPALHLEKAFNVLADMLLNSTFRQEEMEKERWVIFEEIHGIHDTPDDYIHDVIDDLVWDGNPVGRPIIGTEDTIGKMTRDDIISYMNANYHPNRLVISAAGDIDHDEVVRMTEKTFGHMPAGKPAVLEPCFVTQTAPKLKVMERQTEEAHICLGLPAISYLDKRRQVQDSIDAVLSSGMSSRLFEEIRERRGLAYAVFSYFRGYQDVGQGVVYAGTDPEKVDETITAVIRELWKLRDDPVPAEELTRTKELRKGRISMGLEDSRAVAGWLGSQELHFAEILTPEQVMEEIDEVTSEEIQELAGELLQPERMSLAVIGPFPDQDRFRHLLG